MEFGPAWVEWGLLGLFLVSFFAATILPFSSEAVLAAMTLGGWSGQSLLIVASVGNTLGGLTNYAIGRWIPEKKLANWLGLDTKEASRWKKPIERYGPFAALLCWLPVIGDPIAIALGVFRVPFTSTAILMFVGKALRYVVVLSLLNASWS